MAEVLGVRVWFLAGDLMIIGMEITGFFVPPVMNMEKLGETQ